MHDQSEPSHLQLYRGRLNQSYHTQYSCLSGFMPVSVMTNYSAALQHYFQTDQTKDTPAENKLEQRFACFFPLRFPTVSPTHAQPSVVQMDGGPPCSNTAFRRFWKWSYVYEFTDVAYVTKTFQTQSCSLCFHGVVTFSSWQFFSNNASIWEMYMLSFQFWSNTFLNCCREWKMNKRKVKKTEGEERGLGVYQLQRY